MMKWPEVKFSKVVEKFISGGTPSTHSKEYWEGNIPWITGADFSDREIILGRRYINHDAVNNSATNIVPKNSIVMVTRTGVGKIGIAKEDMAISQDITGIILKDKVNIKYICFAISNKMSVLNSLQRGATIKGITRNDIANLFLPLPPLSEQCRIVEILDQADHLRKMRIEADKKAERILPALFIKMFGDPAANPKGWPVVPISEMVVGPERTNPGQSPDKPFKYIDIAGVDGYTGQITEAKSLVGAGAPSRARQVVFENDVIISTVRPYLRATAVVPKEYDNQVCSTGFCVLRTRSRIGFGYLYALTRLQWFTNQLNSRARGASYPAVSDQDILNLRVPLPDNENIMKKFDLCLLDILSLKDKKAISYEKINFLFDIILHRAFSGDLTASWRQAHMKELLQEMETQVKALAS